MGGLGAAALFAQEGYSVLVAERHYRAGGYAHSFTRKKYTFDGAVRIVAGAEHEDGLLHMLLDKVGLAGKLPFIRLDEVYSAHYPDHQFVVPRGVEGLIEAYSAQFPHERENIKELVREMEALYKVTIDMLHASDPMMVLSNPMIMKYRTVSFHDFVASYLKDPKAVYAFSTLWIYFGTPPKSGSTLYYAYAIMSYFQEDIYYLKGSFQGLADAYVKRIEECGGEVCLPNEVKKILVEDKKVKGIQLQTGEFVEAPLIICNGDFTKMVHQLVGADHFTGRFLKRISNSTVSPSAFEVFIGTDLPLHEMGLAHETFVSDRYDYEDIFQRHQNAATLGPDALVAAAISAPTLVDPSLAPEGKHTAIITTFVPYDIGEDWKEAKSRYEEAIIRIAEKAVPDLGKHLDFVESGTPLTMERYTNNTGGAIYGWEQNMKQMISRPQHEMPIQGLYISGHWTDPGGGIVSVLLSAYKLFNKIQAAQAGKVLVSKGEGR